jgi:hypothetical protein
MDGTSARGKWAQPQDHATAHARTGAPPSGSAQSPVGLWDVFLFMWDVFLFSSHSDADTMRTFDRFDSAQAASVATALMGD